MKKKILVIDDDTKLIELLKKYLAGFDFDVTGAETSEIGLKLVATNAFDFVILDIMLPGENGFEVCKKIRSERDIPIIMLTARGDITDRIVGLELGADDYLPKPFEPRELVARIQTVLRRGDVQKNKVRYEFDSILLEKETREVFKEGSRLDISTAEFDVLHLLVSNPTKVFSREQIINELKGTNWATFDRSVDVLISRLRSKLDDDVKKPRYLKTVWGKGYKFVGNRGE